MKSNRDIVTDAFRSWANGDGYVASIFADDMTWEITGGSAVSKKYASTQQFLDEVLHPFGARFSSGDPFRPVNIRAIGATPPPDVLRRPHRTRRTRRRCR